MLLPIAIVLTVLAAFAWAAVWQLVIVALVGRERHLPTHPDDYSPDLTLSVLDRMDGLR